MSWGLEIITECLFAMFHSHARALARVKNAGVSGEQRTHCTYLCSEMRCARVCLSNDCE